MRKSLTITITAMMCLTSIIIIIAMQTPYPLFVAAAKEQISSPYDRANNLLPMPDTSSSSSFHGGSGIIPNVPDNSNMSPTAVTGGNKIPDGSITTSKLADGAVTNSKIANNAVNSSQIQSSSVTPTKTSFLTFHTLTNGQDGWIPNGQGGSFKIDHPVDPANKYLQHSFVESPDMKNIYDGVVVLNDKGEAEIGLPDWFGALNKDFRYQLTAIGAPRPNLHIAEEISDTTITNDSSSSSNNNSNNRFKIAGGTPGKKVSWHVTGIRKDPWANAHRIQVEEDKPDKERGYYMYPDLYGEPAENGITRLLFPEAKARADHK